MFVFLSFRPMIRSLSFRHHAQTVGWMSDAQDTQNMKHYESFIVVICQTPSWKKKPELNSFFSTGLLQGDCTWIYTISPALGFWSPGSPCRQPEGRHFLTGRWIWKNYILPHWGSWWVEWRCKTAQKQPARRTRACIYCTCSLSHTPAL